MVATSALQMEKVSSRLRQTIFAIDAAFDEELPRATILSDLGQAGESQYRYITQQNGSTRAATFRMPLASYLF